MKLRNVTSIIADPSGRAVAGVDLQPSLAGIVGSNPSGCHGFLSLVSVACCQIEVSVSSWSLVPRNLTECGVSECDCEASTMVRTWPTRDCCAMKKNLKSVLITLMNSKHIIYTIWNWLHQSCSHYGLGLHVEWCRSLSKLKLST
jgi:hypothetical protein